MGRTRFALLLALVLPVIPASAGDEEDVGDLAKRYTAAAAAGDVAVFSELLCDKMILSDPVQGVLARAKALDSLSHSHMPPDVRLGAVNLLVAGDWAMVRMPWEHPAIDAGHIRVAGCCMLLRTDEGWKVVVASTVLEPLDGALVGPELLDPYEEQTEQLTERLEAVDHAIGIGDYMAILPMSHPESLWVGANPGTGQTVVVNREEMTSYAAQLQRGSVRLERVEDATDAECIGLRCAAVVRTYQLAGAGMPMTVRIAMLLYWSPQERNWLIVGAGSHTVTEEEPG